MTAATQAPDISLGSITLRGQRIPTRTQDLSHKTLRFFVDNPRIYSLVRADDRTPDQDEICEKLLEHEHVKELIVNIAENGGLMDPVIVRDGDFVVLEGNSRLAAYRHLASKDPIARTGPSRSAIPGDPDQGFQLISITRSD